MGLAAARSWESCAWAATSSSRSPSSSRCCRTQWREPFEARWRKAGVPTSASTPAVYFRAWKLAGAEAAGVVEKEIIGQLLLKGTTLAEVCKAIGWERVSLQRYARLAGLTLTKYEEGGVTNYKGVPEGTAPEAMPSEARRRSPPLQPTGTTARLELLRQRQGQAVRWLVKGCCRKPASAIMPGQWGSYKTTTALDMSLAVMTGRPFAGQYRIKRAGAVLYFALEGAGTLQSRLAAIARHHGAPDKLPFAWRGDCPLLTAKDAGRAIAKYVDDAAAHFKHAYGVPTRLIWIDT